MPGCSLLLAPGEYTVVDESHMYAPVREFVVVIEDLGVGEPCCARDERQLHEESLDGLLLE